MIKKTLKIAGIILLVLIGFAFAAPFLFKAKITNLIKTQINKSIAAHVDFSEVDISLFRNFPRLAVALDSLRITGISEFAEDTLIAAKRIDVALNLMSVISGDEIKIHSIKIDQPRIHALVHKNGHPNWAITLPDSTAKDPAIPASAKPFKMDLQAYAITDGYIYYKDETADMSSEISGLNHSGSGDFTSDLFTLKTRTSTESLSFSYGAIPYLVHTNTNVVADFQVDNKAGKYTFKVDNLALNDLKLHTEGFFQIVNDSSYNIDIRFNGPSLDFKSILSLIPSIYRKDFASIRTSGQASLNGFVKGTYDSRHIPAYHIDLEVKDGTFQYPDLPKPVRNINIKLKADNPDGITDHTVLDIPQGHLEMEEAPFDFRLFVKTPVSDPYIDAGAKGKLDLAKLAQFIKLEAGTRLSGLLNADMNLKGNLSSIEKLKSGSAKPDENFQAGGTIGLTNFSWASTAYPSGIILDNLLMTANPKNITLTDLKGSYGKTHFTANGTLNNLLSYMLKNKPLDGALTVKADQVDLNDQMGSMPKDSTVGKSVSAPGTAAGARSAPPFAVPDNISFVVNVVIDKLHYNNLDMQNLSGSMKIADETVKLDNIKAQALDGDMMINGLYSTKVSKKNPALAFRYDVKNLDVQKTFYAFTTVQKLMPAGKFIAGKFSSQLTMSGFMGENNSPDLNSLNGDGNMLLAAGALKNFAPTDKLAQILHLDQLKELSLKDVKTTFSFRNGKVIIDPFHIKVQDIDMEIGGSHGFDQSLDYAIDLKLPRSLLGGQANNLVNNVVAQAGAKGIPVKLNDKIDLPVKIGGTMTNPLFKTDMKEALSSTTGSLKQQAVSLVQARVDSAKQQLRDTAKAVGKQALQNAGNELKNQLLGKKDTTAGTQTTGPDDPKKKAEEAGKGLLKGLFNKKKAE
ncbi:AsmA family protein [Flavitalea flava]